MANPLRGEAAVKLGGVTITLRATMDGLAQLSAATGRPTMQELLNRMVGGELDTCIAALRLLAVNAVDDEKGEPVPVAKALKLVSDDLSITAMIGAVQPAMVELLGPLVAKPGEKEPDPGNA